MKFEIFGEHFIAEYMRDNIDQIVLTRFTNTPDVTVHDRLYHIQIGGLPSSNLAAFDPFEIWVGFAGHNAIVSPPLRSTGPGCIACLAYYYLGVKYRAANSNLTHIFSDWPDPALIRFLSECVVDKIFCSFESGEAHATVVNLRSFSTESSMLIRYPNCDRCGSVVPDLPKSFYMKSRRKARSNSLRWRSQLPARQFMAEATNKHAGLITDFHDVGGMPLAVASASMVMDNGRTEIGVGRSTNYRRAKSIAALELLERFAGFRPRNKQTKIFCSYTEVSNDCIDPLRFGLHTKEFYDDKVSPASRFDPDRKYGWVWAFSFLQNRPVLVPEQIAYFGLSLSKEERFCVEISNGCAVGSCLEEAILHGLLEVIERDSFLSAWYGKVPLQEINVASITNFECQHLLSRIEATTNSKVRIFDATAATGVPVVWALAVHGQGPPYASGSAAGAHFHLEGAIINALRELGPAMAANITRMKSEESLALKLATDNMLVRRMADHSLLYMIPATFERLKFLTGHASNLLELRGDGRQGLRCDADLAVDLTELINRVLRCGLDVIFVDQTPSNFPRALHAVKVLVPGMLPMTFGFAASRILSLWPQLKSRGNLPVGTDRNSTRLNSFPHPFP